MKGKIETYTGDTRDKNFSTQVYLSLVLKGTSVGLNLLLVPLYINFLGQESYGVWVTLISVAGWIAFMNIGIGNGMRNKISEALSLGNFKAAQAYVSTAYISLGMIVLLIALSFIALFSFLDFAYIFNTNAIPENQLRIGVLIVLLAVVLNFLLSLVSSVLNALQQNGYTSLALIISNSIILLILFIFLDDISSDVRFLFVSILYSFSLIIGSILLSLFTFKNNPRLIPKFRLFQRKKVKDIVNLGLRFFILEMSYLVVFTTDNLIITQLFGASEVTPYYVTQKIFSVGTILTTILIAPLWSAYTEAFSKGDLSWIKNKIRLLVKVFLLYLIFTLILIFVFQDLKNIWVGEMVVVPYLLIWLMGAHVVLLFWTNIYTHLLNGLGILSIQMWVAIVCMVLNIPLSIYFAKTLQMGLSGIIMGTIVTHFIGASVLPIQSYLLLNNKAKGIWKR